MAPYIHPKLIPFKSDAERWAYIEDCARATHFQGCCVIAGALLGLILLAYALFYGP